MQTFVHGRCLVDVEEDGIYIYEMVPVRGILQKHPKHYIRISYEDLPELILTLKEIYGQKGGKKGENGG